MEVISDGIDLPSSCKVSITLQSKPHVSRIVINLQEMSKSVLGKLEKAFRQKLKGAEFRALDSGDLEITVQKEELAHTENIVRVTKISGKALKYEIFQ